MKVILLCAGDPMFRKEVADWTEVDKMISMANKDCPARHTAMALPEWESKEARKRRHTQVSL